MPRLGPTGSAQYDPRAELLLGRAMRPEPIASPVQLLGRLAVLGAGQRIQRGFEEQIAEARSQFAQGAASPDQAARIAAIQAGMQSRDPTTQATALALLQQETARDVKVLGTPGGGSALLTTVGGQPTGPAQPIVQGLKEAPKVITFKEGENERTLLFNPETGAYELTATAPRQALDRGKTEAAQAQAIALSQERGKAQGSALGEALAAGQKAEETARGGVVGRAEAAVEMTSPAFVAAEEAVRAAGERVRKNPLSQDARAAYETAIGAYSNTLAKMRDPTEAVTSDATKDVKASFPNAKQIAASILTGSNPVAEVLRTNREALAARAPPAAGRVPLSPKEMQRLEELRRKAQQ